MSDTAIHLQEIYPLIQRQSDIFFPEFGFKKILNGWEATAGIIDGHKAKGHLYYYDNTPFCFVNNKTGEKTNIWKYVQEEKGLTDQETLKELARLTGYTLPDLTGYSYDKAEKIRAKADILETAFEFFKSQLWNIQGKKTLAYLIGRGYKNAEIKAMDLGYYPSQKEIDNYLLKKGYSKHMINSVGLKTKGFGNTHKLVIPYRDQIGMLKGFIVRAIEPEEPKYKFSFGVEKDTPFNLNQARGVKDLVVVEGFLDALIATVRGISGVIATGGSSLTMSQLDTAIKYGKSITLSLYNDRGGLDGTERSLNLIAGKGIPSYVVTLPDGYKDPDELITAKGVDIFKKAVKEAQRGVTWMAARIANKHDLNIPRENQNAIDETIAYETTLKNPVDREKFKKAIRLVLDISESTYNELTTANLERKERESLDKDYNILKQEIKNGKLSELKHLEEKIKDLRLKYEFLKFKPPLSLSEYLKIKNEYEKKRDPDKLLGYGLCKFNKVSKLTDGIQAGFYIIAAETNVGKTVFLANLFLDILVTNTHTKGIYFSLDDNKDVIIDIFLSIKTELKRNEVKRKQWNEFNQEKLDKAYDNLIRLSERGRIEIKDISEVNHIDTLELEIKDRAADHLFVVIDGLYNLEVSGGMGGLREENIDRANKIKALVDTYKIPIIVTGEIRKKQHGRATDKKPTIDDLMETGKFAYNANIVWLLYAEDQEKFKTEEKPTLMLDFAKNKLSDFKGVKKLQFRKAQGIISEISETSEIYDSSETSENKGSW